MADGQVLVLDTGPLIELCDKTRVAKALAWLQAMRRLRIVGVVPASVVTEFLQGTPDVTRALWWLSHFRGLDLSFDQGLSAGMLARRVTGRASPSPVDAQVVQQALTLGADVLSSDPEDIQALLDAAGARLTVHQL